MPRHSALPDAPVAQTAALLAVPARATMLLTLADGRPRPAGELAHRARVRAPTASAHLARLVSGGLLAVEREGKHHYYRLRDPERLVELLEMLAALAPPPCPDGTAAAAFADSAIRRGRTCYRHLAGVLGVSITDALVRREWLELDNRTFVLHPAGELGLARLGVDVGGARDARSVFARACLDWSERRYHLAGALGAALCTRLFEVGWIERTDEPRVTRPTAVGRRGLRRELGVEAW